ncbi:MAG TPA: hydrogenase maturation protease [Gemmataceae bacterium]|nr:hydrogenase maturation protease [Gemmataceae bacterium]
MIAPIRIVGVGSPNGDDAVGREIVRYLRGRLAENSNIECFEIEGGQRLLELLDGRGTLILIDAITNGGLHGTVERIKWPDSRLETLSPGSTHALRLAEALQLAAALGLLPPETMIFAIAIDASASLGHRAGLSLELACRVPEIVREIEAELTRGARRLAPRH